jgi:ubiquitin carboxyl-terminal hydrolase 7
LQAKANLDDEAVRDLRLLEVMGGKIKQELRDDYSVTNINEYSTLYAERIPAEELNKDDEDRVISAFNFDREANRTHGVPFKFVVKPVSIATSCSLYSYCILMSNRARSLRRQKSGSPSAQASRANLSRRSSLLWFRARPSQVPGTSKMVSSLVFPAAKACMLTTFADDILSDIAGPDDYLGLDHASKSRGFWGKSDSFFIR